MRLEMKTNRGQLIFRALAVATGLMMGSICVSYSSMLSGTRGKATMKTRNLYMATEESIALPSEQLSQAKSHVDQRFSDAYGQSNGLFDDIPNESWEIVKQHVKNMNNEHTTPEDPMASSEQPNIWYQLNWEPNFSCNYERRVGGMGDGPKWVCNPHRIAATAKERGEVDGAAKCLVYSIGSSGNFVFEKGIQDMVGLDTCEIHIFDPYDYSEEIPNSNMHFHAWGILSYGHVEKPENFKSLQETVAMLGHEGRTVDIFKIDCEGCEWGTYPDWFQSGLDIRQILVETHYVQSNTNLFFERIRDEGYVIFHKEPNTIAEGMCQEYAFLKLNEDFFQ